MAARALLCYLCTALLLASRSARAEDAFGRQQGAVEDISGAASADASLSALEKAARAKVVAVRGAGYQSLVDMRRDAGAIAAVRELQEVTRKLLRARYGAFAVAGGGPAGATGTVFHVKCVVAFPSAMPDIGAKGAGGTIIIETAPIELLPHAVLLFLELAEAHAERDARAPAFHRNAGHVLQAQTVGSGAKGLAFQEYSPQYPHVENTLGFAGRPGELCFIYRYILRESCSQFDSLPLTSLMIPQAVRPSTCASLCPWWTLGYAPSDARIVGRRTASPAHATTNRPHSSSPILSLPRAPRFPLIAPSSSIIDNTRNHGPASQGSKSEADSCFGKIREGQPQVERMKRVWTGTNFPAMDKMGFTNKAEDHIRIEAVTLRAA